MVAWETYAGTKTYKVTPDGDTRMYFRIDLGKVGNVGRKFWIANVSMEYTSNDSGITLDNETFNSGAYVSLYPNPVNNNLNIDTAEELKSIKVFDITGQLIKQVEGNVGSVTVGDFQSRYYLVQLTNANGENCDFKICQKLTASLNRYFKSPKLGFGDLC